MSKQRNAILEVDFFRALMLLGAIEFLVSIYRVLVKVKSFMSKLSISPNQDCSRKT